MGLSVRVIRGLTLSLVFLGSIVVGTAGVAISAATPVWAQASNSIVVQGNRRVESETIRSYFRPGSGGRLGPAEIDEGLKSLYATGLFADVQTSNAGGRLVVTVVENPVINQVAFEGNKKAKDDQLKLEVQSKARGTLSKPTVQSDVQRIIEIYQRSGRFDVTVVPKIIELPNNRVNLVFEIKEGEKTGVKDIRFVGNKAFSGSRLKDVIKTSESNFLSFLQTADIYDPDRVEADRDLLRRFYLKYGYADVRIISAVGEYDPAKKGFIITFTIDEGPLYHIGTVDVISNVRAIDTADLRRKVRLSPGNVYNADLVEKSVEDMAIEAAKRGYAFANVRPRGERKVDSRTINIAFVVEEGTRAYIERINIRGNIRTRDYVIRREFDISEGDAYNRALIDRAERRLKNLNFFKTVKITNEPGSAPDRVVVNVNVEETSTGEFSIAGGYSTADGFIAEASVADRNLMGRGQFAKATVTYGQRTRGVELNFVEPYLLDYRVAGGIDLYARQNLASSTVSYGINTYGANFRLGFALSEELSFAPRYSIYRQEITLASQYNDCQTTPTGTSMFGTVPAGYTVHAFPVVPGDECFSNGEATLAVRKELANGPVNVSMVGYTTAYNTLDNTKNPTSGLYAEIKQDMAGIGGNVNFIRTTAQARTYYEVVPDVVGVFKVQGGNLAAWGNRELRMLDHFQMGSNLVRGFSNNGIGPRDITPGTNADSLGGTQFWGSSLEFQTPISFLPKEVGMKFAAFADAGNVWGYQGPTAWNVTGETLNVGLDSISSIRAAAGVGIIWESPLGPLRFDFAYPIKKYCATASNGGQVCDRTQIFQFSGGTKF